MGDRQVKMGVGPRTAAFAKLCGYDFTALCAGEFPVDVLLPKHYFFRACSSLCTGALSSCSGQGFNCPLLCAHTVQTQAELCCLKLTAIMQVCNRCCVRVCVALCRPRLRRYARHGRTLGGSPH
eukprot:COSAG06_NODE_4515_length_4189_cov_12.834230_9_plen_124_part_00